MNANVNADLCVDPFGGSPIINQSCSFSYENGGGTGGGSSDSPIGEQVRDELASDDKAQAIALLDAENEEWANKVLVATYIDMQEDSNALAKLALIPQDTPENIAFHTLYTSLIGGINNGRTMDKKTVIEEIAADNNPTNAALAESALALYFGKSFNRKATPIGISKSEPISESPDFVLYPNPASSTVNIGLRKTLASNAAQISIYNLQGQLMQMTELPIHSRLQVDVSRLPNGVYYCKIKGYLKRKNLLSYISFSSILL